MHVLVTKNRLRSEFTHKIYDVSRAHASIKSRFFELLLLFYTILLQNLTLDNEFSNKHQPLVNMPAPGAGAQAMLK